MIVERSLSMGQQRARTRWGTHESGAAFDRKKSSFLTDQAQEFVTQQAFCVIAGQGPELQVGGLLVMAEPGFVQVPDRHTCLLQLAGDVHTSGFIQGLRQCIAAGDIAHLGLFFICHATRERLCVQGEATLLPDKTSLLSQLLGLGRLKSITLQVRVHQAFFHCAKYIKTNVCGLTLPVQPTSHQTWRPQDLLTLSGTSLSEVAREFISHQVLCFLCTVDMHRQCAVNHRGGGAGFLVTLPPHATAPGGIILLPDYAGNGAFEAIGNILETGQAAIVIPNYTAQLALCVSGPARVLELEELPEHLARRCPGAERVVMLSVQRVETQWGDWSGALAYERTRFEEMLSRGGPLSGCPLE